MLLGMRNSIQLLGSHPAIFMVTEKKDRLEERSRDKTEKEVKNYRI